MSSAETILKSKGRITVDNVREQFPFFQQPQNRGLIYLDSAATAQRPQPVLDAWQDFNVLYNANSHRGAYKIAERATNEYEQARAKVANFIGAVSPDEIVFVRGATEAINFAAYGWGLYNLKAGDEIIISEIEHHSNLVPWQMAAQKTGAVLKFVGFDETGMLNMPQFYDLLSPKTRLVTVTHMSNVLGTIPDVAAIIRAAHSVGAVALVDGSQSVPHIPVNVVELDADFDVFSGHKVLGPMGSGALYARREILENMEPVFFGGSMISDVDYSHSTWNDVPWKFEAGTQNLPGAIGLGAAIDFINKIGIETIHRHDRELTDYALAGMQGIKDLRIYGPLHNRGPVISFSLGAVHPHDLATFLDSRNIAIRSGHHCAKLIMKRLYVPATARASFYLYNTKPEIDEFILNLEKAREYFNKWN